ncbi:MAG: SDR family oxidoreductase [Actinobacteria bacterium]|nr:SDR family oxidoreductase [Actinomycetota bacterium]
MISLEGKVAIVTGGASSHGDAMWEKPGQGSATAHLLAELGASVVVADLDAAGAERRAEEINAAGGEAIGVGVDVREEEQVMTMVAAAIDAYGRLDILHSNAADLAHLYDPGDPEICRFKVESWHVVTETMLLGSMLCCKHAIPAMVETGGGSIVLMTSISAEMGELNLTVYGIAKAGINQLARAVSTQWGKHGVRCNALAPGLVLTPPSLLAGESVAAEYERHSDTPYVGRPADTARVVAFLASDASRYISGQVVRVDGGLAGQSPLVADARETGQMAGGA